MVLGWSWGDFRGFILNRNCNLFGRKRLVLENGIENCNAKKESRNPGFADSKDLFGDDYLCSGHRFLATRRSIADTNPGRTPKPVSERGVIMEAIRRWQFNIENARVKLHSLYPIIK